MKIEYSNLLGKKPAKDIFDQIDDKARELRAKGIKVIDLGVGDPGRIEPPPQSVINSLSNAAEEHKFGGYPRYRGSDKFLQTCAAYMQREFNVSLDPETEINITLGSKSAVFHFPKAFTNPGDLVICPNPGYPPYYLGAQAAYCTPYFVPLLEKNNFLIDFATIPADIASKAKIIWINYPNSPTGITAPREWYEDLIEWAHKYNIIIAADEGAYIEVYYEEKPTSILEITTEGIISFHSLSKRNNMTSYRVGFVAGDKRIIDGFYKLKSKQDNGVPQFVQEAAIIALNDTAHVEMMRDLYHKKREIILTALKAKGFPAIKSDSTFYLWQKAPVGMSGLELANKFIEQGIVVIPGAALTQATEGENPGENYVRIALMPSLEDIKETAARIARI